MFPSVHVAQLLFAQAETKRDNLDYCLKIENFFTNSPQYKKANSANFVLAVTLEVNWANAA